MPVDMNQAKSLFLAVLEMPAHERAAFLEAQCGSDDNLRKRVESMLQAHEASGELLPRPAAELLDAESATAAFDAQAEQPGTSNDVTQHDKDVLACLSPSSRPNSLGRLGHYEIQEVVGQGGFGTVFKAFDEKLHRVVAIKVLAQAYAASGTARKRFSREAQAAAAVSHDHVVGIFAVEDDANPPYLVMQFIDGISLQDKLDKQGPLSLKEILRIGLQMAEGLAAAHKQGLVHRDIKPSNILLENGVERVKITDFGLARAVDDASVTHSGTVAGTPMYMSPEQAEGMAVDHRSDLFSLGTVLYVMCTGRPPFRASGTMAVLKRVIDDTPRPIREINSEIPDWLEAIIAKLHAKKPEERFQTAKEVGELLGQHLAHVQQPNQVAEPPRAKAPAPVVTEPGKRFASVPARVWYGAGLCAFGAELFLLGMALHEGVWDVRNSLLLGHAFFACVTLALGGLFFALRRSARQRGALRLAQAAILCGVVSGASAVALVGISLADRGGPANVLVVTDDPQVHVTITGQDNAVNTDVAVDAVPGRNSGINLPAGKYNVRVRCGDASQLDVSISDNLLLPPLPAGQNDYRFDLDLKRGQRVTLVIKTSPHAAHEPGITPPLAVAPFNAAKAKAHQDAWAKHLGVDVEITNSIGMKLRLIPPGEFLMGTPPEILQQLVEKANSGGALAHEITRMTNEGVQHPVRLTRPFFLGSCEVTRAQFRKFVEATQYKTELERNGLGGWSNYQGKWVRRPENVWQTPGEWQPRDDEPVVHMTWNDAKAFCEWLSAIEGISYTLPTEAQWEFACRAGTAGVYYPADYQSLQEYAWTEESLKEPDTHRPRPVGLKKPNAFGLFDMLGNAWEYCADWYAAGPTTPALRIDPTGPTQGVARMLRGGTWYRSGQLFARCSARSAGDNPDAGVGFRVAIVGDLKPKTSSLAVAPFVVLAKDAKAERKLATLAEAVTAAQAGDTIEIRGDGPFDIDPISINGKALAIRAGAGKRPVLVGQVTGEDKNHIMLESDSALVLEGLVLVASPEASKLRPSRMARLTLVRSNTAPLFVSHCRFVSAGAVVQIWLDQTPQFDLRHSLMLGPTYFHVGIWLPERGRHELTNNLLLGEYDVGPIHFMRLPELVPTDYRLSLQANTIAGSVTSIETRFTTHAKKPFAAKQPLQIHSTANVLGGSRSDLYLHDNRGAEAMTVEEMEAVGKELFDWKARANLQQHAISVAHQFTELPGDVHDRARRLWGEASADCLTGQPRFEGGDLRERVLTNVKGIGPADFRLTKDSPGKGKGEGGKDLGADVDLVGPGEAYEKWKQTPEYQEWRKKMAGQFGDR